MADQLQLRGGTTAQTAAFTGALREVTVDLDKDTLVVHDGALAGGHPLMRENASNSALALGSAGTPSLKFTGDTNTGIYSPGADQVAVATNGVGRLFVDASGNVGVGTASPAYQLDLTLDIRARNYYFGNTGATFLTQDSTNGLFIGGAGLNYTTFKTNGSERVRLDSSGRLLIGTSSSRSWAGSSSQIQIEAAAAQATQSIIANSADNLGALLTLGKSRGTALASNTIVQADDILGRIYFYGADGSQLINGAHITAQVDGTPGTNDMPCRLVFSTTADGGSSPTERMRISANGTVTITVAGAEPIVFGGTNATSIFRSGANGSGIHFTTNAIVPTDETGALSDNTEALGTGTYRWSTIYAATGSINTSDLTTKQDVENLNLTELNVAIAIKSLIKKYRFKDAVIKKGSDARIHVGVIAQEVEQAFVAEGLDPRHYGMFCEDELEDGSKRLGIRYDELLAFVIAAL